MYFCMTVYQKASKRKFRPSTTISIIKKISTGKIFCDWLIIPSHWLSGILSTTSTDVRKLEVLDLTSSLSLKVHICRYVNRETKGDIISMLKLWWKLHDSLDRLELGTDK